MLDADPTLNNFYFRKYRPSYLYYGDSFEDQCSTFLESYIEGTAKMEYQTEERKHENSRVIDITTNSFAEKVIGGGKDKSDFGKRFCAVVEIYKNDCDACHYNGRMFDIFSQKMAKHDY